METLDELKSWDTYRVFMRKYLKQVGKESEPIYVSKSRLDFDINGAKWKGFGILLGKKSRLLAQKMRQEGELFLEGTCSADGKTVAVEGLGDKHVQGAMRTLKKLKLGFEIAGATDDDEDDDAGGSGGSGDAEEQKKAWLREKKTHFPKLQEALRAGTGGPDLRAKAAEMTKLEKKGDWPAALGALKEVLKALGSGGDPKKRQQARQRIEAMDKKLDELLAKLERMS